MNVATYARVSTSDQNCALQLEELNRYCQARGWQIVREYIDQGISGASVKKRQAFKELMQDAAQRKFDCVAVLKLDRFGRSVSVTSLKELDSCGVRFIAVSQGLDTDQSNPGSRLLLNILCCVAEFERELIQERVQLGFRQYQKDYQAGKIGNGKSS
jgi:site-specific DNA recombinase